MKRRAFSLVELLLVIGIIGLLAVLLFPVFEPVREKGRQTVCVSNLHQLGAALALYAQDYDDYFPYGGDPSDQQTNPKISLLTTVMAPYIKNADVWHCPSDTGMIPDTTELDDANADLDLHPSSFVATGMSYYYHTELSTHSVTYSGLSCLDYRHQYRALGSSEVSTFFDGSGVWHGERETTKLRFNILYGDGHVKLGNHDDFWQALDCILPGLPNP